MKRVLDIPIYEAEVTLVITSDVVAARREFEQLFGPTPMPADWDACCSYGANHRFALFFKPEALTVKTIAHEVFHLTHRILEWTNANFDADHHEQGALLHGYLMEMVWREVTFVSESKSDCCDDRVVRAPDGDGFMCRKCCQPQKPPQS